MPASFTSMDSESENRALGNPSRFITLEKRSSGDFLGKVGLELTTDDFEDNGFHYKGSALAAQKFGAFDYVIGGTYEARDLYYDGAGRPVGVDPTQGDTMDSKSWNIFAKLEFDIDANQRLEFTSNIFELKGDGDYARVSGDIDSGLPASSVKGRATRPATRPIISRSLTSMATCWAVR